MKTLVLVEHDGSSIKDATLAAVTAAAKLGEVHLLVAGSGIGAVVPKPQRRSPASARSTSPTPPISNISLPKTLRPIADRADGAITKRFSRRPRRSAKISRRASPRCSTSCRFSEILSVEGDDTFTRPIYAGNAIATVKSKDAKKVITVRGDGVRKGRADGGSGQSRRSTPARRRASRRSPVPSCRSRNVPN